MNEWNRRKLLSLALLVATLSTGALDFHAAHAATLRQASHVVHRDLAARNVQQTMWINPLDFLAGDPSVQTSFNAVSSGIGGGLSGLLIGSTTLGDQAAGGGNKVVEEGVSVPPGYHIKGVEVCYENANPRSFISQVRLAQVQNPPSSAVVLLDDATPLTASGPACAMTSSTDIDPSAGGVLLSLRTNFGNTGDRIVVRAVGLVLSPSPVSLH